MAQRYGDHPDLVVGVDFGMTYTGVAWTNLENSIQCINTWPGLPSQGVETKVPTKIIYGNNGQVKAWGFSCDDDELEDEEVFECFKIYLDPEAIEIARQNGIMEMPASVEDAKRLITDYLQQVYRQIKSSIEATTGSWKNKKVEFIFSTPTTWHHLSITNDFEEAIRRAGFGLENTLKHKATLELTEAEAAGVFVASNPQVRFSKGDIILICDSGGGTTDLGLLQVLDNDTSRPLLKQVAAVKGAGIGSTMIDRAFQLLVQRRIDTNPDIQGYLRGNLAYKLSHGTSFLSLKHNFGTAVSQPEYRLPLYTLGVGVNQDFTHLGLRVERGRMIFSRGEIQALFDTQIRGIVKAINKQLEWMSINKVGEEVKFLVLSGGLGGSAYVQSQLEQKYASSQFSVIRSSEPRLSVVKGLVMDRRQKLVSGTATLKTRVARASYGVRCRQPYNQAIHVGADVEFDEFNKNQPWATNQIRWLIRKGDSFETDSWVESIFTKKLKPDDPSRSWDVEIFISHNENTSLPRMLKQAGAYKLCTLVADLKELRQSDFELKNKRCWEGKRHYLVEFTVRVIIAPADLKFELWFKGVKYNRSHDPIKIEWDATGATAKPPSIHDSKTYDTLDHWPERVPVGSPRRFH